MAHKYELQAARIETVLGAHKVPARVWQATVTPRFVRFDVTTALGTRLTKVSGLAEELAFALGARATRVYREGGVLHVEVPRETARTVALLPSVRAAGDRAAELRGAGGRRRGCAVAAAAGQPGRGARAGGGHDGQREDGAGCGRCWCRWRCTTIRGICRWC